MACLACIATFAALLLPLLLPAFLMIGRVNGDEREPIRITRNPDA